MNSPPRQLSILDSMILIAGVACGFWLFQDDLKGLSSSDDDFWMALVVSFLTGVSLAATPRILIDRIRTARRWRSGALNWVAIGLACWSLAPSLALVRLNLASGSASVGKACLAYCLPIMGLFLLLATMIGGRPSAGWQTCRGWWPEWLGMWVMIGWAATGCYVLYLVYADLF